MKHIKIVLTDNECPLEELFEKLSPHSLNTPILTQCGQLDLQRCQLTVDISALLLDPMIEFLEAVRCGFHHHWNLTQFEVIRGKNQSTFPIENNEL